MHRSSEEKSIRITIWASRIIRRLLGGLFITIGSIYFTEGGWPAILFGTVIFITGFFRPRRCIGDTCDLNAQSKS